MGIFGLFGPRPHIAAGDIPRVTAALARTLEAQRDLFYAGALGALKSEGAHLAGAPRLIERGTEVDSALRALQLVSVVGFSYQYLDMRECMRFDESLVEAMDNGDGERLSAIRESLLDCGGQFPCLTGDVARRIHRAWGSPSPADRFLRALGMGVEALIVMSQALAAAEAGDTKTAERLKRSVGAR